MLLTAQKSLDLPCWKKNDDNASISFPRLKSLLIAARTSKGRVTLLRQERLEFSDIFIPETIEI